MEAHETWDQSVQLLFFNYFKATFPLFSVLHFEPLMILLTSRAQQMQRPHLMNTGALEGSAQAILLKKTKQNPFSPQTQHPEIYFVTLVPQNAFTFLHCTGLS